MYFMKISLEKVVLTACTAVCFSLTSMNAQSLQGKWEVEKVSVEKNIDGKVEKTVYNSAEEVKSHVPCLQEVEVNEKTAVLRYPDGREEIAEYTTKDDLILYTVLGQRYRYEIKGENLILTVDYSYVNNDLEAKKSENIKENWIITLKNREQ